MKKYGLYLLLFSFLGGIAWLLVYTYQNQPKRFNERISLKQREKIPYGFFVARQLTQKLFPRSGFYIENAAPGEWKRVSMFQSGQAVFLVGDFSAGDNELKELELFVKAGNYVFIIGKQFSREANHYFGFSGDDIASDDNFYSLDTDSLALRLSQPRFSDSKTYVYPGRRFSNYFDVVDSTYNLVLGKTASGHPNFIEKRIGDGAFFLHTAPLAFSNYFILHKNNFHYFEQAVSVLPEDIATIVWDEYYLSKPNKKEKEPNMLAVLFRFPSFKWALWTGLFTMMLYIFLEMRRKQRIIPVYQKPKNESLDFVQTIGHLYFAQKNHADLARKMAVHFLEHVRLNFKIPTADLDADFVAQLHKKSGYPESKLNHIVTFIHFVQNNVINESQLKNFYNDLEKFYQST